jgi:hypothetical protein
MNPDEHRRQREAVQLSLLLSESPAERHNAYPRHTHTPCPACSRPTMVRVADRLICPNPNCTHTTTSTEVDT